MFFILGTRERTIDIASGYFLCPACGQLRRYTHKRLARYFTVYFLPLFQLNALGEIIQCQACQRTYPAEALQHRVRLLTEKEFLKAMQVELERGLPLHRLQRRLAEEGLDRGELASLLHQVTRGQVRTCPQCHFAYLANVRFCTNCGHGLLTPRSQPALE